MAALKTSPLAPPGFPELPEVAGVRLAAVEANIHYRGRNDVMLAAFDAGTRVAGVLTRSLTASAPVHWCRERLPQGCAGALIVCAGNANAFTGQTGHRHVRETCEAVGAQLGCSPDEVFVASTGVIGDTLPIGRVLDAVPVAAEDLGGNWESAARAIMTTDTFPKGATRTAAIGDTTVRINGFAKGSGMIEPDMATMLAFVFTDAAIPGKVLQDLLAEGNEDSFNSITVDSDTSTSDTCLLFASGAAGNTEPVSASDTRLAIHFSTDSENSERNYPITSLVNLLYMPKSQSNSKKTSNTNLLTIPDNAGRAIVESGAVLTCRLLSTNAFVMFCSKRGLKINQEP